MSAKLKHTHTTLVVLGTIFCHYFRDKYSLMMLSYILKISLRRGAEDHVQKNQVSRKRIAILQGHSEDVGRGWIIMIVGPQIIVPAFQL